MCVVSSPVSSVQRLASIVHCLPAFLLGLTTSTVLADPYIIWLGDHYSQGLQTNEAFFEILNYFSFVKLVKIKSFPNFKCHALHGFTLNSCATWWKDRVVGG